MTGVVAGASASVDDAARIIALKEGWIALNPFFLLFSEYRSSARLLSCCRIVVCLLTLVAMLTASFSVVDLWFMVGGNALWISLDLAMMMGLMDGAALIKGKSYFMVAHIQFTIG